jgi:hypothetical protein
MMNSKEIRYAIGKAYVEGTFESEQSEFVRKAYEEISRVNAELFKHIPYKVEFTEEDLYTNAKDMRKEVQETGVIKIYSGWSGHPYLTQEQNNIGRAVHDVWAHLVCGCPFNFEGEYNAYLEQRQYYPEWTWRVLFAEIPGQTSAYYYMNDFTYEQRAFEAPQEWLDMCDVLRRDYSHNSILKGLLRK